ncbi:MAG: hypothetical protein PUE08_03150 [Eubacteriales bacterium]|nr:hypothetical protein [Eubacteriales bacterium]
MRKLRKIISTVLVFTVFISSFVAFPVSSNAEEYKYVAVYEGKFDSSTDFILSISSVSQKNLTFAGHVYLKNSSVEIDKDISGTH